jgi:cellulose synthase/poly-beta-1,6-N-acetylglucosamine synthase-like glycosyltransferase
MVPAASTALLWTSGGLCAYVLGGYPVLAALAARVRPRHRSGAGQQEIPSFSVVVPCHDEADVIEAKLQSVSVAAAGRSALREIIVVDDGSTDGTAAAVRRSGVDVRLLVQQARSGKAAAVNEGVRAASGEIVVLTDATAMFEPTTLAAGLAPFADPQIGVVSGSIDYDSAGVGPAVRLYWKYEDAIRRWESASGSTVGVNGNFFAFRKRLFHELPAGTVNDELTIALVIASGGSRVVIEPRAVTRDLASTTMTAEGQRRARITAGRLDAVTRGPGRLVWSRPGLAFRLVSHKLGRIALVPMALVHVGAAFAIVLVGRRVGSLTRALATVSVGATVVLVAGAITADRRERASRPVAKPLRVAQLVVGSARATMVGVVRQLAGGQTVLWNTRRNPAGATATIGATP